MSWIQCAIDNHSKYVKDWPNPSVVEQSKNTPIIDGRLAGTAIHGDESSFFPEMWSMLIHEVPIKSMIDLGCGVGKCVKFFDDHKVDAWGIDGSKEVYNHSGMKHRFLIHDFYDGPYLKKEGDLVHTCEFLEHIDEKYLPNVFDTIKFANPKLFVSCASLPKKGGHHHVNCQNVQYWIEKVESAIDFLEYNDILTKICRGLCAKGRSGRKYYSYFEQSGLVFTRRGDADQCEVGGSTEIPNKS